MLGKNLVVFILKKIKKLSEKPKILTYDYTSDVYEELEDYKSRIDKAVEYIENHIKYECDNTFNGMQFYSHHLYDFKKEDLLNILKGDDNK